MTRTSSLAASFLSLPVAAIIALVGAGGAHAAPSASDEKSRPTVASAKADSTGAADYWTSDRMRAAVPGDVLASKALERGKPSSAANVLKGPNSTVKGTAAKATLAQPADPAAHIGKVFFTLGGANYVCSANAVKSKNRSTVATAGHCLNEGPGAFATNFVFVPQYQDGVAPYGAWTAEEYFTPTEWSVEGNIGYDTGFAVMAPREDKQLLEDVVGGSRVKFNQAYGLPYTSYGYPASKPFNGERLWSCSGTTTTTDTTNPDFGTQGIPCDMTGGSSGGPWLTGTGTDVFQNSVNSYGYSKSSVMYGPYWGEEIEEAYFRAAAA